MTIFHLLLTVSLPFASPSSTLGADAARATRGVETSTTCQLSGRIASQSSRLISASRLSLSDRASGRRIQQLDSGNGWYQFDQIPPGEYSLRVRRGSQARVQAVSCTSGEALHVDIRF